MAKFQEIDVAVSSPIPPEECTESYFVQYKVVGDAGWTLLNGVGYTVLNPILVQPLAPETDYVVQVTRNCCNNQNATSEITFTTPA